MQLWCLSLPGDPAWWQAFTGLIQAILAIAIFAVTYKYVRLTGDLVKLQGAVVDLQKQSERRELYERRVNVYDAVMAFLAKFAADIKAEISEIQALYRATREADFLFGQEVPELISKIARAALQHRTLRVAKAVESGDVEKIRRNEQIENWLTTTAWQEAKETFGHYLKLTEPEAPADGETKVEG